MPRPRWGLAMTWEGSLYAVCGSYTRRGHVPALQGCGGFWECVREITTAQAPRNDRVGGWCGVGFLHRRAESSAQPLARNERYGCGVPPAGARTTERGQSTVVGHDHRACRPLSGRRYRRTNLYTVGSSCTGGDMSPPYRGFH